LNNLFATGQVDIKKEHDLCRMREWLLAQKGAYNWITEIQAIEEMFPSHRAGGVVIFSQPAGGYMTLNQDNCQDRRDFYGWVYRRLLHFGRNK
jgi:hypothetical protein